MAPEYFTTEQVALVEQYAPLVRDIATRLTSRLPASVDVEDMISAGYFGLLQAIHGFDEGRNNTFMTYCKYRIRGAMLDEIRDMDWIGRNYRSKGVDLPMMDNFSKFTTDWNGPGRLDPVYEGVSAESKVESAESVKWLLDRLPKRDAVIVWSYHGPDSLTFKEIGEELGISEGRVSHLYHRAEARLRFLAEKLPPGAL